MAFLFPRLALNLSRKRGEEKTSFTLLESCHGIDQQNSGMILPFERTSSAQLTVTDGIMEVLHFIANYITGRRAERRRDQGKCKVLGSH
jgi:hypothetical protein